MVEILSPLDTMSENRGHNELISRLAKGEMVAFDTLYYRYYRRLYGFVIKLIKQEEEAEEIIQEVFMKVWESRTNIDTLASFKSYLFTITYNTTIDRLRKCLLEKKYIDYLKTLQNNHSSSHILEDIHYAQLNETVQSYINQLTPRQKEIYLLSREEGLTYAEIAKKLNLSVNTVENHMVKALSFLKSNMRKSL